MTSRWSRSLRTRVPRTFGRTVGRIGSLALLVALVAVVLTPAPAHAHGIGGIRPSNYETRVLSVRPTTRGVEVTAVDLGDRLELRNTPGADVTVLGYDDEPYLRVGPRGVFENRRSPAVYLNRTRTAASPVPERADPKATPEWRRIGDGTTVRWHDHRTHWMGRTDPPAVRADPGVVHQVQPFVVKLRQGAETIRVTGDVRWIPGPAPWPWIGLALLLALVVVMLSRTRFAVAAVGVTLVVVAVSEAAHIVGGWGGTTVGAGTKLAASVYAVGGIVVSVLALVWLLRRGLDAAAPLVLVAGLFLALAGGLADVTVLTRSQLPTTLPDSAARLVVSLALGLGLGLAGAGALRLRRQRRPQQRRPQQRPGGASPGATAPGDPVAPAPS
ncbi:MAG: phage holin family protein [Acidimicrobiia bacterium]|nr:phage holin family protein [Acidimicrobiia bacterium]